LILASSDRNLQQEITTTRALLARQVDGIIFASSWYGTEVEHIQAALAQGVAVVFFDRHAFDLPVDTVGSDNLSGGRMAGEYLVSLGHRRLACIAGLPEQTPNAARALGFIQAVQAAGIPAAEIPLVRADFDLEGGYQAAFQLLSAAKRPTGLFACNDLMAIGAMRAALVLGLRVPEDLSIIGFDNLLLAQYANPPLTTIDHHAGLLGELAASLILSRIQNPELPLKNEQIQLKLLVRQSTAPPPEDL
jgi:LacI family transcriptional regulator